MRFTVGCFSDALNHCVGYYEAEAERVAGELKVILKRIDAISVADVETMDLMRYSWKDQFDEISCAGLTSKVGDSLDIFRSTCPIVYLPRRDGGSAGNCRSIRSRIRNKRGMGRSRYFGA